MFLGSNNAGPIKSIAGGFGSRSSSTDDSSSSSSTSSSSCGSCSRRDIGPDDVGEKEKSCHVEPKSQSDFCTLSANAPSSDKLPTNTETDGGAFVAAGDEETRLALDLTDLHLRPYPPPCPQQQQVFSYSGAAAAARKQRPLIMHHSATIYEEEGEFDVLSEYTSSSSSVAGTPNSGNFFFGGDDDLEEKEDSCIKHIPRLGEWKVVQEDSTSSFAQHEAGADNGARSLRQWMVASGVGLNIVLEEDEAESVNIARHAAIGTLGRKGQQATQNADPAGSTLRGENRRANARARARAYARARANLRGCVRTQVSTIGPVDPPPVRQSQGFSSLGDINSSDVDAPQVRLKSSSDFVYLTPRDKQQLRRLQQRQQIIGEEGDTLAIKEPRCFDVKAERCLEDNDSDDGLYHSKNVVDVRVPEGDHGCVDEMRSLTPDTGATSISSTSSSGKSCKVESNGGGGGGGDGMSGVEQRSVFDRRVRSGKFHRSSSTVQQANRASIGFRAEERSFERSDSFSIFTRNKSHSSVCKGRSQSLKEDSAEGHRQSNGVLRSLSRGISKVWDKVTADHPDPLPVSRTMTKEERKALRRRRELELLEDWQANSTAELHQVRVVCKEEETVWR